MEAISFPISREAACCGIYIYLGSTRVGMKSKEQLRSEYLRKYEDSYKSGLERRRKKLLEQKPSCVKASAPVKDSDVASASSFLSMIGGLPKTSKVNELVIDNDMYFQYSAIWVKPAANNVTEKSKDPIEWAVNGVELFSIVVEKPVETVQNFTSDEGFIEEESNIWEDAESDIWNEPAEESEVTFEESEVCEDDIWEGSSENEVTSDDIFESSDEVDWGDDDIWIDIDSNVELESQEESAKEIVEVSSPQLESSNRRYERPTERVPFKNPEGAQSRSIPTAEKVLKEQASTKNKSFADVKNIKPSTLPAQPASRLDENAVRDFVKSHKLCSESDIISAFSGYDRVKVKSVIKSALRKYKIFEKHGKFTV